MYLTATIGGVTRGRQFDLFVDDHYLLAGEFHVQNDCMIVVPENDRPQASDPAFLAERDEIIFYRYDYGSEILEMQLKSFRISEDSVEITEDIYRKAAIWPLFKS